MPPVARAGPDQTVKAGRKVDFNASQSSDNVGIVSYVWDFGDGTTGTGKTTTHTYPNPGTYTVKLTVTDAAGNSSTDTVTITVEKDPFPSGIIGTIAAIGITAIIIIYLRKIRRKRY